MPKRPDMNEKDGDKRFLLDTIQDLKKGLTTYVYKKPILDKLKDVFNDLDIKRNDFYWIVKVNK